MDSTLAPEIVNNWILLVAVAFARVGTAILLLPGFGEAQIPPRIRIALGLVLTLSLLPILPLSEPPDQVTAFTLLIGAEAAIGIFIGAGARILIAALHLLGALVGMISGLSNAFAPSQANTEGATALAALLSVAAIAMIFATELHHLMISTILRSYAILPPGQLPVGDLTDQIARLGAGAFQVAISMATPFLLVAVVLNLALGLANRIMPTMQVFFVAAPGLILAGLTIFVITLPAVLDYMMVILSDWLLVLSR